jgi:hypothetical protein
MMQPRRTSVIATLFLLAWTATASAECAWVLWKEITKHGQTVVAPKPEGAHTSRDECVRVAKSLINPAIGSSVEANPSGWSQRFPDNMVIDYLCLPDTVDPRGPKKKVNHWMLGVQRSAS